MHHYDEALVWLVHIIQYIINKHKTKTEKLIFSHLATSHFPCLKNPISHVISDDIKLLQLKEMHYQRRAVIELKYQTTSQRVHIMQIFVTPESKRLCCQVDIKTVPDAFTNIDSVINYVHIEQQFLMRQ